MFEQTFKNIDDILRKDAGCGSELDYVEHQNLKSYQIIYDGLEKTFLQEGGLRERMTKARLNIRKKTKD